MMPFDLNTAISFGGYAAFIAGGVLYTRSKVPKQTIDNYEKLADVYERRIKALEVQSEIDQKNHLDNVKALAEVQGQLKVYKELPLQDIAMTLQNIAKTNELILDRLDKSADLLIDAAPTVGKVTTTTSTVTK